MSTEREGLAAEALSLEVLLYEHRADALTCYDHGGYCCVCGEHDSIGYRTHLVDVLAARDRRVRGEALREYRDALAGNESAANWMDRADFLHDLGDWATFIESEDA